MLYKTEFLFLCLFTLFHAAFAVKKVSVITLTFQRPEKAKQVYENFKHQTYSNKELLILDDSPEPSEFFQQLKNDSRVHYYHSSCKRSVGGKRNFLIKRSTGHWIAHFDDDDIYAPDYLKTMISQLQDNDFIKSSKWLVWREMDKTVWEWNVKDSPPEDLHFYVSGQQPVTQVRLEPQYKHGNQWGFGFSYVYLKSMWETCRFPRKNFGEDYDFVQCGFQHQKRLTETNQVSLLVLHTLHRQSSSWVYPQKQLSFENLSADLLHFINAVN